MGTESALSVGPLTPSTQMHFWRYPAPGGAVWYIHVGGGRYRRVVHPQDINKLNREFAILYHGAIMRWKASRKVRRGHACGASTVAACP